jgi:hypothetical protein
VGIVALGFDVPLGSVAPPALPVGKITSVVGTVVLATVPLGAAAPGAVCAIAPAAANPNPLIAPRLTLTTVAIEREMERKLADSGERDMVRSS